MFACPVHFITSGSVGDGAGVVGAGVVGAGVVGAGVVGDVVLSQASNDDNANKTTMQIISILFLFIFPPFFDS